jgi:hypothetical protein
MGGQNQNWKRSDQPKDSRQKFLGLKRPELLFFVSCAFSWSLRSQF